MSHDEMQRKAKEQANKARVHEKLDRKGRGPEPDHRDSHRGKANNARQAEDAYRSIPKKPGE